VAPDGLPREGDSPRAEGAEGGIVLVVDVAAPASVRAACAELAAALADRAGEPVTLAAIPDCCLAAMRPALTRAEDAWTEVFWPGPAAAPRSQVMSSAPFLWREDGRPDWAGMWTTFCDLALYGGPPHRGPESPLRAPPAGDGAASDLAMVGEMRRGIWETTGLYAEPAEPGWLAVTCESRSMAAWLCAVIILENVEARVEEDRLLLPAGPAYVLADEVKSIVTVMAKTHHYWQAHIAGGTDSR